jgi:N-methylhydantoinase B
VLKRDDIRISSNARVQLFGGGGGGWGDPLDRDASRVVADVRDGYISADAAWRDYGVLIDESGRAVDASGETGRTGARMRRHEETS